MTRYLKFLVLAVLILTAGYVSRGVPLALAASVLNYFAPPAGSGKDNVLNLDGTWKIGGTAVLPSAAELNVLDGGLVSTTELNYLDGVPASLDFFTATLTTSFNAIAASICKDSDAIPTTGASIYDPCDLGPDPDEAAKNIKFDCFVSGADETKIHICNNTSTSIDIASGTYKVRVWDQ